MTSYFYMRCFAYSYSKMEECKKKVKTNAILLEAFILLIVCIARLWGLHNKYIQGANVDTQILAFGLSLSLSQYYVVLLNNVYKSTSGPKPFIGDQIEGYGVKSKSGSKFGPKKYNVPGLAHLGILKPKWSIWIGIIHEEHQNPKRSFSF